MRDDGVAALEGPNQRKMKQCFTLNKKAGSGLRLSLGYGEGLVQSYIEPFRGVLRMKTDLENQIKCVFSLCVSPLRVCLLFIFRVIPVPCSPLTVYVLPPKYVLPPVGVPSPCVSPLYFPCNFRSV